VTDRRASHDSIDRPLAGVRVVDFAQYIDGPLAALLLSEQGAGVVHIDPPGGSLSS
jgi:crotonobetainyl-CoA:carnitine CoA-transferase CaiB-like acyl-CoA transferase